MLKIHRIFNRIHCIMASRRFAHVGQRFHMGPGFQIQGEAYISVGENFSAGNDVSLEVWNVPPSDSAILCIGNNVVMAERSSISCSNRIIVGNGVLFGVNSFVCDNSHGSNTAVDIELSPSNRPIISKGEIHICDNVWIGRNACIFANVKIGKGSIVGANAVVTHDVPPYSIVAGVPAHVIRTIC